MMRKFLHFTSAGIVSRENVSCGQNSIPTITFPIIIRWQMDTPLCFLRPARRCLGSARTPDNLNCSVRGQKISSGNKPQRGCVRCLFARNAIVIRHRLYFMLFGIYLRSVPEGISSIFYIVLFVRFIISIVRVACTL